MRVELARASVAPWLGERGGWVVGGVRRGGLLKGSDNGIRFWFARRADSIAIWPTRMRKRSFLQKHKTLTLDFSNSPTTGKPSRIYRWGVIRPCGLLPISP
jgi:hypothetical protein